MYFLSPKIANKLHLMFKCFQMKDSKHPEGCLRVFTVISNALTPSCESVSDLLTIIPHGSTPG